MTDLASRLQFWEINKPLPSPLLSDIKRWKKFWEQYHGKTKKMCLPENVANCLIEADRDASVSKYFYAQQSDAHYQCPAVTLKDHFQD